MEYKTYDDSTRMNGGGMPGGVGATPFGYAPRMIDGAYKSTNVNSAVGMTQTVFDPTDNGIGYLNRTAGKYESSEPRPFSKA